MFKIYLKSAWRNLWKSKFYNGLSLVGLSLGLCVAIFIAVWINAELSYNEIGEADHIYRVSSNLSSGENKQTWGVSVGPVAYYAKNEVPEVENAVRLRDFYGYRIFSSSSNKFEANGGAMVDPEFFSFFNLKFIEGNLSAPFSGNNTVVITEKAAKKYFGTIKAIGKTITADYENPFIVTGIIEDLPSNTSLDYELFFPLTIFAEQYEGNVYWKSMDSDWGNFNFITYLKLKNKASVENVTQKLTQIQKAKDRNAIQSEKGDAYYLQPIQQMNLYSNSGDPTNIKTVRIFGIVLILILCIACINYVNLNTARSIQRAKEVSLRKLIGADRSQLFIQFIIESCIFFLLAIVLAIVLIYLLAPSFNSISGKQITFSFMDAELWAMISMVFVSTLIASSIYPAVLLSSFKPLEAIKGNIVTGVGAGTFRKILVCLQFSFSVILIISTIIIGKQLDFITSKNPGYDRSQVLTFNMPSEMRSHKETVANQVENLSGIVSVAFTSDNIVNQGSTTADTNWDGKDPQTDFIVHPIGIDESFIPIMKMKLLAGENFKGRAEDSVHFILNETAVKQAGIEDPIGKSFELWETKGIIAGVVQDFNFASMKHQIAPAIMYYDPDPYRIYIKTINGDISESLAAIEDIWNIYNPGFPFQYSFLDAQYETIYRDDIRTGKLFKIFSILAIFVSCLGLFGLTTYTAQLKKREIGIRKILGASVSQITSLLSKDFLKLIVISCIIAIPTGWYFMQSWLQNFAYKTNLDWWIFAGAGTLTLLIALITISSQAIKAALSNPVKNIKTE
ncbi:ABC transporter permease [Zunongwangia endophytica]|uniref:ABC transporter permease n=1 Tax=Zunongwangia endophytica TaxID=1808945 RepID=A0ABV8H334_9FLAO|nr:ABC transporter permease [Zunongwangia endophytica]MDN3596005.1 ABC transporter permease [Zunongwangia endophytica]